MVLSLIYGKQKYAQSSVNFRDNGSAIVTFDTMVSEEHRYSARVTDYPVEFGTIISDHIFKQPDTVHLSGLITDTPLTIFAPFNRSVAAFNTLVQIFENRQVVDIVTGIKIYRNMAMTLLDVPRTVKTGQTLTFNIQFQRITFDQTLQVYFNPNNIATGVQDNTPREFVADNANIPLLMNDPPGSLKDQASSQVNVGVQSLDSIPTAVLPNILENLPKIAGVIV
jgi:RNase H-fold protein (predicted Holliday junction resolvase)